MTARTYTTRRLGIVEALVKKLKTIDDSGDFLTDIFDYMKNSNFKL